MYYIIWYKSFYIPLNYPYEINLLLVPILNIVEACCNDLGRNCEIRIRYIYRKKNKVMDFLKNVSLPQL